MDANNLDDNIFKTVLTMVKRLMKLYVTNARLIVAERLTRLLSAVAMSLIILILGVCALIFVTLAVGRMLMESMADYWCLLIIAIFYILLIALLIIFRKQLLENPVSRFISSLIVTPPQTEKPDDE